MRFFSSLGRGKNKTLTCYLVLLFVVLRPFAAGEAISQSEPLPEETIAAFRNARTIRIVIDISFEEAQITSTPFLELAEGLFSEYLRLNVVATGGDILFSVSGIGRALSAWYSNGKNYSGAQISGKICLQIPGKASLEMPFENVQKPPGVISFPYPTPNRAPFWDIIVFNRPADGSFIQVSIKLLGQIYGTGFLLETLRKRQPSVFGEDSFCRYSIEELVRLKNIEAIKPIFEVLKTWDGGGAKMAAISALGSFADPDYAALLVGQLKTESSPIVFEEAGKALIQIGRASLEPLIGYLQTEKVDWKLFYCWNAVEKITKINFGRDLDALLKWWGQNKDK